MESFRLSACLFFRLRKFFLLSFCVLDVLKKMKHRQDKMYLKLRPDKQINCLRSFFSISDLRITGFIKKNIA